MNPLTTFTIFTFTRGDRLWAFSQMGMARPLLLNVPGLTFHRLMGAGRGVGFTMRPDWGRYAFLGVWADEPAARAFFTDSPFIQRYRARAAHVATAYLRTTSARGTWAGRNPLPPPHSPAPTAGPVAVLTRATINLLRAGSFWSEVPHVSRRLESADGLIASIGVGEAPLLLQATFSLWRSEADVKRFAYASPEHRRAIHRTRREDWYKDELFARFHVLDAPGFPALDPAGPP